VGYNWKTRQRVTGGGERDEGDRLVKVEEWWYMLGLVSLMAHIDSDVELVLQVEVKLPVDR